MNLEPINVHRDIAAEFINENDLMIAAQAHDINTHRDIAAEINQHSYAVLAADDLAISPALTVAKQQFSSDYDDLKADNYLKNNGSFRLRRFANFYFLPQSQEILPIPHSPYFQAEELNSYAGGIDREFAPLKPATLNNAFLHELIKFNFRQFPVNKAKAAQPWYIDAHQIRIIATADEEGEPTPEGVHHDENDFGCIHLISRDNIVGGVNTIYDNNRDPLQSIILDQPMDTVMIWDPKVMHGVSHIRPQDLSKQGVRDVLLIGYNYAPDLKRPGNTDVKWQPTPN